MVLGDYNIYNASEPAYQALLDINQDGYVLDPINQAGTWHNNPSFASIHTQSTRTRSFGGGSPGGMDDRFDMILISRAVKDTGGIFYITNSYHAFGNDGLHFNDSINAMPNSAVSKELADALQYASDHLPVVAEFIFDEISGIGSDDENINLRQFKLFQNYPNPFNPSIRIKYRIPKSVNVRIKIHNILGEKVVTFLNRRMPAGDHTINFNASSYSSGIYFYSIEAGSNTDIKKMILMK
jgi:hypothetical protein